jgi:hypothetical protein
MDALEIVTRRLRRQRLAGEPFESAAEAVAFFGAVQSQDFAEAKWSLGERLRDVSDSDLDAAFDAGEILRTHVLRPTWHFVTPEDIGWMLELTAPRVHAALGSAYRRLKLDDRDFALGHETIGAALAGRDPLIRTELVEALRAAGIGGERLRQLHVIIHAELEGLICSGARRGKQHTYTLLAERAPAARRLTPDAALAELTRRYFTSHGPATANDFSWWSGLTLAEVRRGLELAGEQVSDAQLGADDARYDAPGAAPDDPVEDAFLIGMFDESVIAYQDLRFAFAYRPAALDPLIRPIVIGGLTVGTWRRVLDRGTATVEASPFGSLAAAEAAALEACVARLGRFLGIETRLAIV